MKKIMSIITFVLMLTVFTAGGNMVHAETADTPAAHSDILVAYFSATGTTKGVAERIASVTGGDLYEILPAEPYTEEDLNYNDSSSRTTIEQNDKSVRPEIGSEEISLEDYTTIYLGFPIWWGEEPRILDTFAEKYSFEGITVIPFCTSGGSGIGRSGSNMETLAGSGTWLEGERFNGNVSEEDLQSWIDGLQ
ncbi:MAG: flavodoxin [Eubacterium sp.]|nr:flavodoxin [Eubacterium sp.]